MNRHMLCVFGACSVLATSPALMAETASPAQLPELPSVSGNTPTVETYPTNQPPTVPGGNSSLPSPSRQMPSATQMEQLKKDRNWLVEGMKERQAAEREAAKNPEQPQDMSQSIIDMVLKKQQPAGSTPANPGNVPDARRPAGTTSTQSPRAFQPSISTSSFEPLPNQTTTSLTDSESVLARERAQARLAGVDGRERPVSQAYDILANPFANLPVPEASLPSARTPAPAAGYSAYSMSDPTANNLLNNPGTPAVPGFNPGGNATTPAPAPGSNTYAPGVSLAESGAPAPQQAIEQPYEYLRVQEQQRRQQELNSNRPRIQDLRNPVPDPTRARLF